MNPAISARGVDVIRGSRRVLEDVNLDILHGRVLALVGPNGAGKSTLLGALAGDLPAGGDIIVGDRPLGAWAPKALARQRAVLLQDNSVAFAFSVRQVVEMGRSPWLGVASAEDDVRAIEFAVQAADIGHLIERAFPSLSGGERARVSLARVLAQSTDIVLLDEPTAALDLRHQEDVMALARTLADQGRAVVVVLHDLSLAAAWADDIAIISHGRLTAHGSPVDVLTPERIAEVYRIEVHVLRDPDGRLMVVPKRGA